MLIGTTDNVLGQFCVIVNSTNKCYNEVDYYEVSKIEGFKRG